MAGRTEGDAGPGQEVTRAKDTIAAGRALPAFEIGKNYVFTGSGGKASLADLFDGRRQLITCHFMWRHEASGFRRGSGLPDLLVPGGQHRAPVPPAWL